MKTIIITLSMLAVSFAAPQGEYQQNQLQQQQQDQILRQESVINSDGFHFLYETSNGIFEERQGELKDIGSEELAQQISGQVSYTSKEGEKIDLTYTADENGYHPVGNHLPTPPPIPEHVQRLLDVLATASPQTEAQTENSQYNNQNYPSNYQG